jgi:hypothetical protein
MMANADTALPALASREVFAARTLLLVAHPDDEVLGASVLLRHAQSLRLVHATDGSGGEPGFAVATEAALKLKETAGIHAEAISAAELLHGPITLAGRLTPILAFAVDDASRTSIEAALPARAAARGRDADAPPGLEKVTLTT